MASIRPQYYAIETLLRALGEFPIGNLSEALQRIGHSPSFVWWIGENKPLFERGILDVRANGTKIKVLILGEEPLKARPDPRAVEECRFVVLLRDAEDAEIQRDLGTRGCDAEALELLDPRASNGFIQLEHTGITCSYPLLVSA